MVGPLRQAPGGFTHLFVVVEKFSKWIEARPIVNVRSEEAMSFFTDIIYCFGIPNTTITDNGTQLTGKKFSQLLQQQQHSRGLVYCGTPEDKWTSREGKRHDLARVKTTHLQASREVPSEMGGRATVCAMEPTHHTMPGNGLHIFLHGARPGSGPTDGY
jgi:hypothetical protein